MRTTLEPDHDLIGEDEPPRDLVLGAPALIGIFVAVSVVCAVCFGFGYSSAHSLHPVAASSAASVHVPVPLSGSGGSAPVAAAPQDNAAYARPTPDANTDTTTEPNLDDAVDSARYVPSPDSKPAARKSTAPMAHTAAASAAPATAMAPAARPRPSAYETLPASQPAKASPAAARASAPVQTAAAARTPTPEPAASGSTWVVQIAAVSKAADAASLAQALRRNGFAARVVPGTQDSFFHVQVGPLANLDAARAMRSKLADGGYNAFIKH